MNLTAKKRVEQRKSHTKEIRRKGNIPAIFYAPGQEAVSIEVEGRDFDAALRGIKQGMLATATFNLNIDGKKSKAIVKDIQYDLTSYKVIHLDFEELSDKVPVQVKVPVVYTGVTDSPGIKLGGYLRQVLRFVKVVCLPKDIPQFFEVNVGDLGLGQVKRLSDLKVSKGVKLPAANEVLVVIAKR